MKKIIILLVCSFVTLMFTSCGGGVKAFKDGNYDKCIEIFTKSTTNGSGDFADEYWFLGRSYEITGNEDLAYKNKAKAYNICENSTSERKDFQRKYPAEYELMQQFGSNNGMDVTDPESYELHDLKWVQVYGKEMGYSHTSKPLVKIAMKVRTVDAGTYYVYDNSERYGETVLHYTNPNINSQLKDFYYRDDPFMAYCEIRGGMLYVNFIEEYY